MPPKAQASEATRVTTLFCPYDAAEAEFRFIELLSGATKKIRMSCYALTDPLVVQALLKAQKNNLDIQILMDKTQSGGSRQKQVVRQLKEAKIPLVIGSSPSRGQLLHSKFVIVDDKFTEDGSWNFTGPTAGAQSNTLNFSDDPKRAMQFNSFWQKIHDEVVQHNLGKNHGN